MAFRFAEANDLLRACKRLHALPFTGESAVYADGSAWYLLLIDPTYPMLPDPLGFLPEYGTRITREHLRVYLSEHAQVVCGRQAVARLADLSP